MSDSVLDIEADGRDRFVSTIARRNGLSRLFGGQVAAQALLAASHTVDSSRAAHSLHAYFVRAGRPEFAVQYDVVRIRDGQSFSTRRVTVTQQGETILELLASFHEPESGAEWQMGGRPHCAPPPAADRRDTQLGNMRGHLDIRPVAATVIEDARFGPFWFRAVPPIGDDPARNAAMLTYVSDIALLANAREPDHVHEVSHVASLDHALWFHRRPRVDEWLLFVTEPVAHIGARGTARGTFHTESGDLVATVVQEGLMRPAQSVRR